MSDFNEIRIFFKEFSKNTQVPNLIRIRQVGAELFHGGRQTDRHDEANNCFS